MLTVLGVTEAELIELELAHLRLLGEPADPCDGSAQEVPPEVAREARRSLTVRGLVSEDGLLVEEGEVGLLVATVLDLRLAAERVLAVDRLMATTQADEVRHGLRLVHLGEDVACVEDVLPDGLRHLGLALDPDAVTASVVEVTVPPDAAPAGAAAPAGGVVPDAGAARMIRPARPAEMGELLGRPTVLAELTLLDRLGDPVEPAHLVALGPGGCWVGDVDRGRPVPTQIPFQPVDPAWVADWVRAAHRALPDGQGTMCG